MIKEFKQTKGLHIETIPGQIRYAVAKSDDTDFYEVAELANAGVVYKGNSVSFYDFEKKESYEVFAEKEGIVYDSPVFINGRYYILKCDYSNRHVTMLTIDDVENGKFTEVIRLFFDDDFDLFNMKVMGDKSYIVSQKDKFKSFYPVKFSFDLQPQEIVVTIENEKVYIEKWIEEGWDDINDRPGDDYKFYHKVIVHYGFVRVICNFQFCVSVFNQP